MFLGIPSPLNYYLYDAKERHRQNVEQCLNEFTAKANVDRAQNAKTVEEYDKQVTKLNDLNKKVKKFKLTRGWCIFGIIAVFAIITILVGSSSMMPALQGALIAFSLILSIVGIVLLCKKIKKKLKELDGWISTHQAKANVLLQEAYAQVKPLNDAFTDDVSLRLFEKTLPCVTFDREFSEPRLLQLVEDYGYSTHVSGNESIADTLSGELNDRPFLYDRRIIHTMGTKSYYGSLQISWSEQTTDKDGNTVTVTKSETLTATVVKPYPEYYVSTRLYYGHEAIPALRFSRTYQHVEDKTEKAIERKVEKGERKLLRMQEKSLKKGGDFAQVENTEFEVLFNATDRNDELDFREMFTVQAQANILKLLLYKDGYGDDFNFVKHDKLNIVESEHSHMRSLYPTAVAYRSHDITLIENAFKAENEEFFKAVYFDFAPILAIPAYQCPNPNAKSVPLGERTQFNYETIANKLYRDLSPADACTSIILKASSAERSANEETFQVLAKAYKGIPRTDIVSVHGGDGYNHDVSVDWTEYIPVERTSTVRIVETETKDLPDGATPVFGGYAYVL